MGGGEEGLLSCLGIGNKAQILQDSACQAEVVASTRGLKIKYCIYTLYPKVFENLSFEKFFSKAECKEECWHILIFIILATI